MKLMILIIFVTLLSKANYIWAGGLEGGSSDDSVIFSSDLETGTSNFIIQNFPSKEEAYKSGLLMGEKMKKGQALELEKQLKYKCADPRSNASKLKIIPLKMRILPQYNLQSASDKFETRIEYESLCSRSASSGI